MKVDYEECSEILKALAHPVRLQIVIRLSRYECNVNKIAEELGLPQSTVSQHLGILRRRGIVSLRKEGVCCCYSVTNEKIKAVIEVLSK